MMPLTIPIGISNRHFHISQADLETLFGAVYQLTRLRDISQKGQFAANETLTVVGLKEKIERVRIDGPTRGRTQLEISCSDVVLLGLIKKRCPRGFSQRQRQSGLGETNASPVGKPWLSGRESSDKKYGSGKMSGEQVDKIVSAFVKTRRR